MDVGSESEQLERTNVQGNGPELFIAFIGAVGTDLKLAERLIEQELRNVGYSVSYVKLSDLLLDCAANVALRLPQRRAEDERIHSLMQAGDALRRASERGDAVALLAMGQIRKMRRETDPDNRPWPRHAYLLHSLKHPGEIRTLREVYGPAFIAFAVYTPKSIRAAALRERIARSRQDYSPDSYEPVAQSLIDTDEKAAGDEYGQNVRDTFPAADVFLNATDPDKLPRQAARMVEILFGHPFHTPTVDEYGLFHAKAAALRSADLSRQVGAVIMTGEGEIIAAGCNEVPKAGGGAVLEGRTRDRTRDRRDYLIGYDSTARMKREIFEEIFTQLRDAGWLAPAQAAMTSVALVDEALFTGRRVLSGSRAASIIEFGRIVHAEMSAITDAARRGLPVKGATLYCTTFPCHMCARHIIASGISRVVYIEPYPKSMARDLYKGALSVEDDPEADDDAVRFVPFVGVSPARYIEFFEMPRRKDERGMRVDWKPDQTSPRMRQYPTYLDVEAVQVDQLDLNGVAWGIVNADGVNRGT